MNLMEETLKMKYDGKDEYLTLYTRSVANSLKDANFCAFIVSWAKFSWFTLKSGEKLGYANLL